MESENTIPLQQGYPPPVQRRSSVAPRSPLLRVISSLLLFVAGIIVGIAALSAFFLLRNPDHPSSPVPPNSQPSALVVQANSTYVTQAVQQRSASFGVPGTLKNLQVTFVHEGPVTISGDDELGLLGLTVTRHFTMDLQLYAASCKPAVRVLHADFSGIPITGFVIAFEQSLNQELQVNLTGLPPGFTYCVTAIHTEPQGALITFSAQPAGSSS